MIGLDMKDTLEWYESNKEELLARLPEPTKEPLGFRIRNRDQVQLSTSKLASLVNSFPNEARERSLLRYIVGRPETWFHKDSLIHNNPTPTEDIDNAISSTAIVPSYHSVTRNGWPNYTNIWLYQINPEACSEDVRKIVLAEGFTHEFAHTINAPALYFDDYQLQLPSGENVNALDYLVQFANLAENHSPMSPYSSVYWTKDNKLNPDILLTAINEELAETIAARLLGFTYCKEDARGLDPFIDRPEVKEWVDNYLNAKIVK